MEAELSCPLCGVDYSEDRLPRILAACGHSFCEHCIEAKITSDGQGKFFVSCPEDSVRCQMNTSDSKTLPINRSLLKIAESAKSKTPHKDSSFQLSKTTKEEEFQQDMEIHEFKEGAHNNLLDQSPSTKTHFECAQLQRKEQNQFLDEQNMCLLHQKPLEIVCVYDLQKVCSKCAIFGEHKGHDFKSLEQIQEEKNQFCQRLGTVFGLKKEIMNRIQNKTTKSQIISILSAKTHGLSKQVKQKFKALIDAIVAQESRVLAKLQSMNKKVEKQIDNLYKMDISLASSYDDWEISAMEKLDCMKKGSFEEQLKLLIKVESVKQKNSLFEGQSLVDLMKAQQQNIISNSQALLGSLNLKVSDKIFEFIPTFVDILDKPELPEDSQEQIHPFIQYSPQGSNQINLLQIQSSHEQISIPSRVQFQQSPIQSTKEIQIKPQQVKLIPFLEGKVFDEKPLKKPVQRKPLTKRQFPRQKMKTQFSEQTFLHTSRQISFVSQKSIRSGKKKLKNIKVPQKYQKILESLSADTLQTLDLTNAQLGDAVAFQVCQLLNGSKVKTAKLIRNKLTDEGLIKILPFMGDLVTLNLSQNLLTEKALDILISNRNQIPKLKNIVLSLNKIVERKDKKKIDELRKFQITVSV